MGRSLSKLEGVLAGSEEPVFQVLPQRVLDDMRHPNSESAILWNSIYPRAQPTLSFAEVISLPPLWGSFAQDDDDELWPYYWGNDQGGQRLRKLDQVLQAVDGAGPRTEVDLFLLGRRELVLVEAKNLAGPGRCSRYRATRCPEIHGSPIETHCRYWESGAARFGDLMDFGSRPMPGNPSPPCDRHYQLARTLTVGARLAVRTRRRLHLWLIAPRARWRALERNWLDFTERVSDDQLWQRLRVVSWEEIHTIDIPFSS